MSDESITEEDDLTPLAPEPAVLPSRATPPSETDLERADRRIALMTKNYLRDPTTGEKWNATNWPGVTTWLAQYAGGELVDLTWQLAREHEPQLTRLDVLDRLLAHPEKRLDLLREDPLLALIHYFFEDFSIEVDRRSKARVIALNDLNFDLLREARMWVWTTNEVTAILGDDAPFTSKAIVGPRESGKSHLMIKMLPLWALAFGHVRFMVLATDTKNNAESQFSWWVGNGEEKDDNDPERDTRGQLLKNGTFLADFPTMGRWTTTGQGKVMTFGNGAVAAVDHIDGPWRGLASGNLRPDLVLADDVDARPAGKLQRRLASLTRALGYLGRDAWMYLMGTTTTYGNVTHQLLMHIFDADTDSRPAWTWAWETIYCAPIRRDAYTGEEFSYWPDHPSAKLKLTGKTGLLARREHDPTWANEMENRPELAKGGRWSRDNYVRIKELSEFAATEFVMHLDPAKTSHEESDYSAVCVVGLNPHEGKLLVALTAQTRWLGGERTKWVQEIVDGFEAMGRPISYLVIEANTAGEDFYTLFADLTIPVFIQHVGGQRDEHGNNIDKEARMIRSSVHYHMRRIVHLGYQMVEEQQLAFGAATLPHDDLLDVTASAILWVFDPQMLGVPKRKKLPPGGQIGSL